MDSFMKFIKDVIIPGITVLTGAMVVYLNYSVSDIDLKLKESQEQRSERESFQSFDLKIYDKVIASLESDNPKRQQVAKALVVVMASDSFRTQLLSVLEQVATDTVKEEVKRLIEQEREFKAEEEYVKTQPKTSLESSNWKNYNYDIFWCEKSGENAKQLAENVIALLKENGAIGRLRIRQLPESVNARRGYQIAGYVIRANKNEIEIAKELQKSGKAIVDKDFVVTFSSQATPLYISAFICP